MSLYTIGLQARDYATVVMESADVVIAIGYDFVEYAPCFWNARRDKLIVHVDASPAEVDEHYIVEVGVLGDIRLSLEHIGAGVAPFDSPWPPFPERPSSRDSKPSWPARRPGPCGRST